MADRDPQTEREYADALVASFARTVGARGAKLDASGDVSFGECGFHFDAERGVLVGRVFVSHAGSASAPPEIKANFRKVAAALEDPAIGGMFEKGGGTFVLDEEKRIYFLTREFPVGRTTEGELRRAMEDLLDLGAVWTTRWFRRVAAVAHGWEPAPTRPVTRADEGGR